MLIEQEMYMSHIRPIIGEDIIKVLTGICRFGKSKMLELVSNMLFSECTIEREFGIYKKVQDNWPKYVVSMDEIDMSRNGIKHMNIRNFLLAS